MASHLEPEQQMTVAALPQTGSLQREWRRCGKPTCRCTSGMLHGPYYQLPVDLKPVLDPSSSSRTSRSRASRQRRHQRVRHRGEQTVLPASSGSWHPGQGDSSGSPVRMCAEPTGGSGVGDFMVG
jgi:hypothetical protein